MKVIEKKLVEYYKRADIHVDYDQIIITTGWKWGYFISIFYVELSLDAGVMK